MTQKSAILIITEDSPRSNSPAGERVRHLASASSSFFNKVIVLALGTSRFSDERERESEFLLYEFKWSRVLPYPIMAVFDPIKVIALFMNGLILSKRYKASRVLASMPPIETGVSAWLLARICQMKLAIDLNDDWESALRVQLKGHFPTELMKPVSWITGKIYSFSANMLVVTPTLAKIVRERKIETNLILAPNGADTSMFLQRNLKERERMKSKFSLPEDKILVAYCGSGVVPYYRLDVLLSSVRLLPNEIKGRIFFIFFLNNGEERLTGLKERLNIPDNLVEIRAPLPRAELANVLAACDVGLVPFDDRQYLRYATSTKVYEYLSSGLYVVASGPKGGELNSLFLSNSELGLFISPNVQDFVHVFEKIILKGKDLFKDAARNARNEFVRQNFNWKENMAKAVKVLSTNLLD